jgi:hypothetical protein
LRQLAKALTAASAAGFALSPLPAAAQSTANATVQATIAKPLILTWVQDFDLGTIMLGNGAWSTSTVTLTRNGLFTCGANLTCTGQRQVAIYNVSGTNRQVVRINAPNVTLVNQANPASKLTLIVDTVSSVTLTNSGAPGTNFSLGGSITFSSATEGGTYLGMFNVTVDYQ